MKVLLNNELLESVKEEVKQETVEGLKWLILDSFIAVGQLLVESIGAITLIGSGILILLKVVGYDKGYKQAGILFTINVLVKYLLGGL